MSDYIFTGKWTNSNIVTNHIQEIESNIPNVFDHELILYGILASYLPHQNIDSSSVVVKIQRSVDLFMKTIILSGTTSYSITPYLIKGSIIVSSDTSFSIVYVENKDFIIDYSAGTISRASTGGSISDSQTVYVYYIPYEICVLNSDYTLDSRYGYIRRMVGSSIPSGATVFIDYSFVSLSSNIDLIESAINQAESYMSKFMIDVTSNDDILESIATFFALSIICKSFGIKELLYRADNSDDLCKQWNSLSSSYKEHADNLFSIFKLGLPEIVTNPSDISCLASETVVFSITAKGDNLSYLWQENGVDMAGETKTTLSITTTIAKNNNVYRCKIINSFTTILSTNAKLSVSYPYPVISQHPENVEAALGETVTFSVLAEAPLGGILSYLWQGNGIDIPGATNPTYELTYDEAHDGFSYRCKITNTVGGTPYVVYSKHAILNMQNLAPKIIEQPEDITTIPLKNVSFDVTAEGDNLTFQWYANGSALVGKTLSSLLLQPALIDNGKSYYCIVSNSFGSVKTNSCRLIITSPYPEISYHPKNITCFENEIATFAVTAHGESLTYQWQADGVNIVGETKSVYRVTATKELDGTCYRCVVTNTIDLPGSSSEIFISLSDPAFLNLTILVPKIIEHPKDFECYDKSKATFSVTAEGVNLTYLWQKNGSDLPTETKSVYELPVVDYVNTGDTYRCKVSNSFGTAISNSAILHIKLPSIEFSKHPSDIECIEGEQVSFAVNIPFNLRRYTPVYQWQKNGASIPGETKESLTFTAAITDHNCVYRCYFSSSLGNVLSNAAILKVNSSFDSDFSAGGTITNRFSKNRSKNRTNPSIPPTVRKH